MRIFTRAKLDPVLSDGEITRFPNLEGKCIEIMRKANAYTSILRYTDLDRKLPETSFRLTVAYVSTINN